ncbi:MAG: peptidylprolyl isomerase [Proteobacteria bacterium]|nr:peptidylprolyl isomerase [Pseudomonadota bacterium]
MAIAAAPAFAQAIRLPAGADPENTLVIELKDGPVIIRLRPDLAPKHVERIKTLARQGFYDGIVFHRVIEGFMAQTGDPQGTGMGGSQLPNVAAEFSREPFVRGTLGMARSQNPNSANSQFFICFAAASFLNGQYTVFGNVIQGMEAVDKIKRGNPAANGTVTGPDRMVRVRVAADIR